MKSSRRKSERADRLSELCPSTEPEWRIAQILLRVLEQTKVTPLQCFSFKTVKIAFTAIWNGPRVTPAKLLGILGALETDGLVQKIGAGKPANASFRLTKRGLEWVKEYSRRQVPAAGSPQAIANAFFGLTGAVETLTQQLSKFLAAHQG